MTAILFGSIGTLADTSELQRASFNEAFQSHGLDWKWSREEYQELLQGSGGAQRIADYAAKRGDEVDAAAVHATKSELFQKRLQNGQIEARPGVAETIDAAREAGVTLGLVTTTSAENISALARALRPAVDVADFAVVVDTTSVKAAKPAPDAYRYALERLDEQAGDCVAIEDNVGGVQAADAAGIACVAFPGENNAGHEFAHAALRVDALSLNELRSVAAA